jgi:hypothetical protein
VAKNRDKEPEFRLRPQKPAARSERRVYASAYRIIMHHARMSGVRRRHFRLKGAVMAQLSETYS